MKTRSLFARPLLWISASGVAAGIILACSSTTTPGSGITGSCQTGDTVACTCSNGQSGTGLCNDPASCSCNGTPGNDSGGVTGDDSGPIHDGDGGHVDDSASPTQTYGACARQGSFGWPCVIGVTGADPTDCTDPNFPICFKGGQGSWCTAACESDGGDLATACHTAGEDAGANDGGDGGDGGDAGPPGCIANECNVQGYCKIK